MLSRTLDSGSSGPSAEADLAESTPGSLVILRKQSERKSSCY
jgi:hypothetical protein